MKPYALILAALLATGAQAQTSGWKTEETNGVRVWRPNGKAYTPQSYQPKTVEITYSNWPTYTRTYTRYRSYPYPVYVPQRVLSPRYSPRRWR